MHDDYSDLDRFLGEASRPAETFTFHELQGFLFAIASSPETVPPSEWLPMIGNDKSLNFAGEAEAERILGLLMNLYNEINLTVLERRNVIPPVVQFAVRCRTVRSSITQISRKAFAPLLLLRDGSFAATPRSHVLAISRAEALASSVQRVRGF
jgi:hypothetical protein